LTICGTKRSTVDASIVTMPLSTSSQRQVASVIAGAAPTSTSAATGAARRARCNPAPSGRRIAEAPACGRRCQTAASPSIAVAAGTGDAEQRDLVARIAQLALGAQDEHRQALERRRENAGRAREQELVVGGRQTMKLACSRPFAEQKPPVAPIPRRGSPRRW
jgi:hypothetical protein